VRHEICVLGDFRVQLLGALRREERVVLEPARRQEVRRLRKRTDPEPDDPLAVPPDEVEVVYGRAAASVSAVGTSLADTPASALDSARR
jgi:hypothetical protein